MKDILKRLFDENSIPYDKTMIDRFSIYKNLLVEWNSRFNLTAITDDEGIALKHFVDSLSIAGHLENRESLADVGAGAGFPGIPLKIAGFGGKVVLMDSLGKRIKFLDTVISELGLGKCEAVHIRAEDAGRGIFREKFDAATARAVASLPVLSEYCLPLVKPGGIFIAMKGPEADEEVKSAGNAVKKLGGMIKESYKLEIGDNERTIVLIDKKTKTPAVFPRKAGTPKKKPL